MIDHENGKTLQMCRYTGWLYGCFFFHFRDEAESSSTTSSKSPEVRRKLFSLFPFWGRLAGKFSRNAILHVSLIRVAQNIKIHNFILQMSKYHNNNAVGDDAVVAWDLLHDQRWPRENAKPRARRRVGENQIIKALFVCFAVFFFPRKLCWCF